MPPLRVLTVGDGDLSYSLALQRALGDSLCLSASVLLCEEELTATYASAASSLQELRQRGATFLPCVDATSLSSLLNPIRNSSPTTPSPTPTPAPAPPPHPHPQPNLTPHSNPPPDAKPNATPHATANPNAHPNADHNPSTSAHPLTFDHVIFNHPHLGLSDLHDERAHANRHGTLISHFLHSSIPLLSRGGVIHLTLCGNQPSTWEVERRAQQLGLRLVQARPTTSPHCFFTPSPPDLPSLLTPPLPEWRAGRRYRNGALGSKHWLGRYGYEHRRCEGDAPMNVDNSVELIFEVEEGGREEGWRKEGGWFCSACKLSFDTEAQWSEHIRQLQPDPTEGAAWRCEATGRVFATEYALKTYERQLAIHRQAASNGDLRGGENAGAETSQRGGWGGETAKVKITRGEETADAEIRPSPSSVGGAVTPASCSEGPGELEVLSHVVPPEGEGQRVSRWAKQQAFVPQLHSKRLAAAAIEEGRLLLHSKPVEGARVLKAGDVLELLHDRWWGVRANAVMAASHGGSVALVHVEAEAAVVWKPVGMRACGEFAGTLQAVLHGLLPPTAAPPPPSEACVLQWPMPGSRIEIGCSGLCLVARTRGALAQLNALAVGGDLHHSFVALVHGRVPDCWAASGGMELSFKPQKFTPQRERRRAGVGANRKAEAARASATDEAVVSAVKADRGAPSSNAFNPTEEVAEEDEEASESDEEKQPSNVTASSEASEKEIIVVAEALQVTPADSPVALSTVRLSTGWLRGRLCGELCHLMRSSGYPVVGDRYAKRERGSLPRCCAALKNKLQVGCYSVSAALIPPLQPMKVERALPVRLMASHWHEAALASAVHRDSPAVG